MEGFHFGYEPKPSRIKTNHFVQVKIAIRETPHLLIAIRHWLTPTRQMAMGPQTILSILVQVLFLPILLVKATDGLHARTHH